VGGMPMNMELNTEFPNIERALNEKKDVSNQYL
jgi:hypothetical protein